MYAHHRTKHRSNTMAVLERVSCVQVAYNSGEWRCGVQSIEANSNLGLTLSIPRGGSPSSPGRPCERSSELRMSLEDEDKTQK